MAPCNGTTYSSKVGRHPPPRKDSALQWHQWHPRPLPPKLIVTLPPNHSTLQWHPTMAQQWRHVLCTLSAKVVRRPPPLLEVRSPIAIAIWEKNRLGKKNEHLLPRQFHWDFILQDLGPSGPTAGKQKLTKISLQKFRVDRRLWATCPQCCKCSEHNAANRLLGESTIFKNYQKLSVDSRGAHDLKLQWATLRVLKAWNLIATSLSEHKPQMTRTFWTNSMGKHARSLWYKYDTSSKCQSFSL